MGDQKDKAAGVFSEKISRRSFGKLIGAQTLLASTVSLSGCLGSGGDSNSNSSADDSGNTALTRAAFLATISDYFDWVHSSQYTDMYKAVQPTFVDVTLGVTAYAKQIETALEESVVSNASGYFYPEELVTREDAADMYVQAFKIAAATTNPLTNFTDASAISSSKLASVKAIVAAGYMGGKTSTTFEPKGHVTVNEAKTILSAITTSLVAPVHTLSKPGTTAPRRYVTYYTPTPGAQIYITETSDGSEPATPNTSSTTQTTSLFQTSTIKYDFAALGVRQYKFSATGLKTVRAKAVAVKSGMTSSAVREFSWVIYRPTGNPFEARLMHAATSTAPAVWQIYNDSESVQSHAYLIIGTTRAILLDALETDATGSNAKNMKTLIDSLVSGLPYDVLIGHAHGDHAAQMYNFTSAGINCYATQLCRVELLKQAADNASNASAQATLDQWATAAAWTNTNCITVSDGHQFSLGNVTCTALVAPGHTNGMITLIVNETGWVYSSDMWGCNRPYSADTTSFSAVKADLFLSISQQVYAKYKAVSSSGTVVEVTNAHQEAGLGVTVLQNFLAAYQRLIDDGVSAYEPSIRNGYYGTTGSNGQGMLKTGDMWRNKNWIAAEPGQVVSASGTTLSTLSSSTNAWSTDLPLNYNTGDNYKKYSQLANVVISGGTLDLSTTTVTWGSGQTDGTTTTYPYAYTGVFFNPWKYAYNVNVSSSTSSITISPTALSSKFASMKVNGTAIAQGGSTTLSVANGTQITITVVAQDGSTSSTYTFTVVKAS